MVNREKERAKNGAGIGDGGLARRETGQPDYDCRFLLEREEGRFRGENRSRQPKGSDGLQGRFAGKAHAA